MKTQGRTKGWTVLGALALLGTLFVGQASAAQSDSLTVTITPVAAYEVDITTGGDSDPLLNLGSVNLGASTFTVNVTTVEVRSSYATTELSVRAQVISGGFSIDTDTTSQETDALQAWAIFTDTSIVTTAAAQAGTGDFDASDLLFTTNRDVGDPGTGSRFYELAPADAGRKDMEDLPSVLAGGGAIMASKSHLWMKFTLPPVASAPTIGTAQRVYITVTAGATN